VRPALWIAADLLREALAVPALRVMAPLLALGMPAYHGALDGWLGTPENPMRLWLSAGAVMPAVLLVGLFADVIMPRILTGEIEPLLAAPVTDRHLVLAHMAPVALCQGLYLVVGIPLTMGGFHLVHGAFPEDVWRDALHLALGSTAASLLVAATMGRALMSCRSVGAFALRSVLPLGGVAVLDALCWALRAAGHARVVPLVLAGAAALGAAAVGAAASSLRRERLLARR
jgi:hypothetical protein